MVKNITAKLAGETLNRTVFVHHDEEGYYAGMLVEYREENPVPVLIDSVNGKESAGYVIKWAENKTASALASLLVSRVQIQTVGVS